MKLQILLILLVALTFASQTEKVNDTNNDNQVELVGEITTAQNTTATLNETTDNYRRAGGISRTILGVFAILLVLNILIMCLTFAASIFTVFEYSSKLVLVAFFMSLAATTLSWGVLCTFARDN